MRDEDHLLPLGARGRLLAVMPRPSDLAPADTSAAVAPLPAEFLRPHHPAVTEMVTEMVTDPVPSRGDIAGVRAAAEHADVAVIGPISAGTEQARLVQAVLDTAKPTVTAALRTPFDPAAYAAVPVHLCTYSPPSMEALADAIFGVSAAAGGVPATIPGLYPRGHRWAS